MPRKFLNVGLVVILGGGLLWLAIIYGWTAVQAHPGEGQEFIQSPMLQATVQITMLWDMERVETVLSADDHRMVISERQVSSVAYGLGTLVRFHGETVLVTHNHWTQNGGSARAHRVQFFDAQGNWLLELDGGAFQRAILYQDSGTLILLAPDRLAARLRAADKLGDCDKLVPGSLVQVARRQPGTNRATLLETRVTAVREEGDHTLLALQSSSGEVIRPGDSGGGVWQQGTLVGTMWSAVEEQLHLGDNPGPLARVTTRRSLAAGLTACLLRLLDQSLANRQVISDVPADLSVE